MFLYYVNQIKADGSESFLSRHSTNNDALKWIEWWKLQNSKLGLELNCSYEIKEREVKDCYG